MRKIMTAAAGKWRQQQQEEKEVEDAGSKQELMALLRKSGVCQVMGHGMCTLVAFAALSGSSNASVGSIAP